MTIGGRQIAIRDVAVAATQSAHHVQRLVARIQPVRREADHQESRLHAIERGAQRWTPGGEIEIIHGLGDVEVRIRVEAVDELTAPVTQVAFHFELILIAQTASEFFAHGRVAHVGDVSHHARHGQATGGRALAVIVAFVPIEVGHDGLASHFVECDLLRAVARGSSDGDGRRRRRPG